MYPLHALQESLCSNPRPGKTVPGNVSDPFSFSFRHQFHRYKHTVAGLYLHIPFCAKRCIYCDFYFVTTQRQHHTFVEALQTEITYYASEFAKREPIETIYFGGGTPSLLSLDEVERILDTLYARFDTSHVHEISFEVNPDDLSLDYLRGLRALGVNRLSVGIQSFFEDELAFLGRVHTAEQAQEALELIPQAGFENYTIDLIFGLPDQTPEYWAANLSRAVRAGAPHISTYNLTVEPRTVLHKQVSRGRIIPPPEEEVSNRYQFTIEFLEARGYEHYEISNFAQPGYRSQHNQLYWEHRNYLGFGPSAHAFWKYDLPESGTYRWANVRNLRKYEALLNMHQLPLEFKELVNPDTLANEYIMLRLRTSDGLDLGTLEERYGVDLLTERVDELAWLESEGFIHRIRNGRVRLTTRGKLVCDAITARLLIDTRNYLTD